MLNKIRGTMIVIVSATILLVVILWLLDMAQDQAHTAIVIGNAPLYSLPPTNYPKVNPVQATLNPNDKLTVLSIRYGKDFETLQVKTSSGKNGWVILGEGIHVE